MTNYEKLINTLKEAFMLDKAELDFGIYRIMNQKREEIEHFLQNDLIPQAKSVLAQSLSTDTVAVQKELDETIKQAQDLGANPDTLPKVIALRAKLGEAADMAGLENEIFSLLANFFKRYFDNGDFISMRRYKKDVYAIPYEGEEVKLHWANADQYYIKTSEYFRNYRFKLTDGKTVSFELVEAETEQNNNKIQGDKERKFALYAERPVEVDGSELKIYFVYEGMDKKAKQDDLLAEAFDTIKPLVPADFIEVFEKRPTEKDKDRTLLMKHMKDYTVRNTFDYFIHKDLHGFLTRELDFYIKNEVLYIDDVNTKDEQAFVKQLSKIKAVKKIGEKIISFLAQLENFQRKLWLKKKFVVETQYCITLDRVPEEMYKEIAANEDQREEWVRLFAIDEIKKAADDSLFGNSKVAYSKPLTVDFLKQNLFLVLDTRFFSEEFKLTLISHFENFDEQCDGLMINSDNFHALSLLTTTFNRSVNIIYTDPPYNSKFSEILYKNSFKHSSWLSLIENRVNESVKLLVEDGTICIAIDENEKDNLALLMSSILPYNETVSVTVVHNPRGIQGRNFSYNNEFAIFSYPSALKAINEIENPKENWTFSNLRNWGGESERNTAKNCFYPIFIRGEEIIGAGEVSDDDFHPLAQTIQAEDETIAVYPIDIKGIERKWRYARQTFDTIMDILRVRKSNDRIEIELADAYQKVKTTWVDKKYDASIYGTQILTDILGAKAFDFPKSIYVVMDSIRAMSKSKKDTVLDFFAGSGTTGHAIIKMNRDDKAERKFILVEMGTYFDTVTKPRIQKVIYSKEWKDGKPVGREGISHCFKYLRLESYEDTLNNLSLERTDVQKLALDHNKDFREGYMLHYMLDVESRGSLLNTEWFKDPFNCYLNITRNYEMKPTRIDLVETFNYLIGLVVEHSYAAKGYRVVTGHTLKDEKILIVWRNLAQHSNKDLNEFLQKSQYNPLDNEFDRIYVNGDNNVENLKLGEERWKVVLIEEEFSKKMFEEK